MFFFQACRKDVRCAVEIEGNEPFRNGDLVLRCGHGMESKAVTARSSSVYSHIGILMYDSTADGWHVLHAVPGESPKGEPDYLKSEPLSRFFSIDRAGNGAWMRIDCADSVAAKAALYCRKKVEEKAVFDSEYLLEDSTCLYCTELVWRAYMQQGLDISGGRRTEVPILFCEEGECIFPCDIEKGERTLYVKPFKTKQL